MREKGRKIVIFVLAMIALVCAGYLIWYYMSAAQAEESMEKVKEVAVKEEKEDPVTEISEEKVEIPIDFDALQAINPDVYAWIRIDGTVIDYPVVQRSDDDSFYLDHTWEGKPAADGAIFTQACNAKDFTDFNTVIYGHQMGAGVETMFHQLGNYLNADFMQEHRDIMIYTPDHIRTYRVFAAVVYDDRHLIQYYNFVMNSDRQAFIDSIYNSRDMRNQFCEDEDVTIDDQLLSLSTCIAGEPQHRLLVEAVLIDEK